MTVPLQTHLPPMLWPSVPACQLVLYLQNLIFKDCFLGPLPLPTVTGWVLRETDHETLRFVSKSSIGECSQNQSLWRSKDSGTGWEGETDLSQGVLKLGEPGPQTALQSGVSTHATSLCCPGSSSESVAFGGSGSVKVRPTVSPSSGRMAKTPCSTSATSLSTFSQFFPM